MEKIELIVILIFVIILFMFISLPFMTVLMGLGDNSEGIRTGIPVKLSYKGWIWRTWEGEMSIKGTQEDVKGGVLPYIWRYSICDRDENKIKQITEAIEKQKEIVAKYRSPFIFWKWNQKTKYCIEEIYF